MRTLLMALALALAGCVTSSTSTVTGMSFEPRPKDYPIAVYANEIPSGMEGVQPVSSLRRGGTTIGHVTINAAEAASWNTAIRTAQSKARRMGGDAIVIESWGYVPVTGYAYSGGMALPVTSAAKGMVARVERYN